jgi:hypothetical protein
MVFAPQAAGLSPGVQRREHPISGQLSVVSGQWSVVSGQWSVVSGRLSVVGCRLSVVGCRLAVGSRQSAVGSRQMEFGGDRYASPCGQYFRARQQAGRVEDWSHQLTLLLPTDN